MNDPVIRTVTEGAMAEFTVQGSRFIGHVAPISSETDAEAVVAEVATANEDATHVVSAYRLAGDPALERADDDGEPSGSAGKPALGVLAGEDLEDTVAVIVRYYGGTNLGYGGLVRAYARAVSEAVAAASIETRYPMATLSLQLDYDDAGTVRSILESEQVSFDAAYDEAVDIDVEVPDDRVDPLLDRLQSATSGRIRIDP